MALLSGKRVVILEDSAIIAMDLAARVEALGGSVVASVGSVREARAVCAPGTIDLALFDVRVRDGTSIALAAELCARGVACPLVTGYGDLEALPAALEGTPILRKPVSHALFEETLEHLCAPLGSDE